MPEPRRSLYVPNPAVSAVMEAREKEAAAPPAEPLPRIPPAVKMALGALSPILGTAAALLPSPWGGLAAVLAVACALGAGLAVKVPAWVQGKPLVRWLTPAVAVPVVGLLLNFYQGAPDSLPGGLAMLGAVALCWLAGVPLPTPVKR